MILDMYTTSNIDLAKKHGIFLDKGKMTMSMDMIRRNYYEKMGVEGVPSDAISLACVLKACVSNKETNGVS